MEKKEASKRPFATARRWIRRAFILWAIVSTLYLVNSFRTQGVDAAVLKSNQEVEVVSTSERLEFQPVKHNDAGLIFLCGSGVSAEAYAPLLRPLAELGYPVVIVRLPWRFAPMESNKEEAIRRAISAASDKAGPRHWVVGGHSLGAALSCRAVAVDQAHFSAMVLLGTTHPKETDLSQLTLPVTKVYGDQDGVAPLKATLAN
jgi:pimeloyl-ACP methyl ester carboxylesterase